MTSNIALHTVICKKCGEECVVDGECPKFFAFCDTCHDYADYNMDEFAIDHMAAKIENAELMMEQYNESD